jgi:hypothetical protein
MRQFVLTPRFLSPTKPLVCRAPAQTYAFGEENQYSTWVRLDTVGQRGGSPPPRRSLRGGAVSRACVVPRADLTFAGDAPYVCRRRRSRWQFVP